MFDGITWFTSLLSCCLPCHFALSRHPQHHQCITHLSGSLALRPLHHSPHFTICSVACVPPPPVLWTATRCSLIPCDTVPIIMVVLFCFLLFELHLLQHHATALMNCTFAAASKQLHTSLMPLCCTSCATNCHDHELHKCSSVEEVALFLLLPLLIIFV